MAGSPPPQDWYEDDPVLRRLLALFADEASRKAAEPWLARMGQLAPATLDALAREADRRRPELAPGAGPGGEDTVRYGEAYRALQRHAREGRAFTLAWHALGEHARAPRPLHFAAGYLYAQAECGYYCPACMTDGAAWALARHAPEELQRFCIPRLVQDEPRGAWEGAMLLTEHTGGSDLGGSTTRAEPRADGTWALHGEKYFASNCTADVILTLARMPGGPPGTDGLGLFLVPRELPGGARNRGIRLVRLKDKLGVTSMATAEVEFEGATGFLLAGEGQGFKAMTDMVNLSRLYNSVASVAVARRALREAVLHGRQREAFGHRLLDLPLYRVMLVGLALDVEGALVVVLATADAMDRWQQPGEAGEAAGRELRALTPLAKSCTAKLAVRAASEACEAIGGNGYVEDASVTPRLLRDAQVLPIWEGTTHIQALEFLRAMRRERARAALRDRVQAWLEEARRAPDAAPLAADLARAWAALDDDAAFLAGAPKPEQQAGAWRLAQAHYHAVAATLLAWAAARAGPGDRERALLVARGYLAAHVAPGGAAGARAVERLALEHGLLLLGEGRAGL